MLAKIDGFKNSMMYLTWQNEQKTKQIILLMNEWMNEWISKY